MKLLFWMSCPFLSPFMALNFGGGGGSSSSSSVTNNTDKRLAVGDGGFGLSADNSIFTDSRTSNFTDSRTSNFTDSRTSNFTDNSTVNTLDGGAIDAAFGATKNAMGTISDAVSRAFSNNANVFAAANETVRLADATNGAGFTKLIDTAAMMFNKSEGLIGQTQKAVADAYSTAITDKAGGIDQKTIIVLSVAAAAAVFAIRK